MFSASELAQLLQQFPTVEGHAPVGTSSITVHWLLKLSVMVQSRGVLCDKGYIVFATCE
ncbi:hypothetical protein SYNPS1DRAFT_24891 [Syncephalis pseudoplumigaleata]|uniref:Uncharacterized protein n=1 Tax=Syncephalis pseudoplumigaleata TaxID=1712513 RepID=A0A4P9YTR5_9FUNG|nr:hypothetical protein SYNPS1DRAFT_25798 [Syncephalis pseudoplumigaleata]RKP23128.1 hypothetical protein SYNPS1DRAFT_24891 [Syncephalis pseudoplumigaleata]|eukprot:RKP22455.1 hypothetical protein SYNPS1DRAFT_25798 [Syncephalis pseudoplumigaleata]